MPLGAVRAKARGWALLLRAFPVGIETNGIIMVSNKQRRYRRTKASFRQAATWRGDSSSAAAFCFEMPASSARVMAHQASDKMSWRPLAAEIVSAWPRALLLFLQHVAVMLALHVVFIWQRQSK